jgi:MFS family permease
MTHSDLERGRALMKAQSKPKTRTRSPKGLGRRFKSNQGLADLSKFASEADEFVANEREFNNMPTSFLVSERRLSMAILKENDDEEAEDLTGTFVLDPQDILMAEIYAARRAMQHQNHDVVNMLAMTALGFDPEPVSLNDGQEDWFKKEYEQAAALAAYKKKSAISGVLNLVSSFIYMANYLIVVPTVVEYSNKLGADPALSSFIVGMTPFATIFSTILYSWWTSYSYRVPLMFSVTLNIIGNITYAMGYPCNSMILVLLGRLMQGLGSCRPINRRYIADAYSTAERTAASAIFVAVGSFGMASGPFLGSLLHSIAENSSSPYWQVENAPGFFMSAVWSVYAVFHFFFFVDPPKQDDESRNNTNSDGKKTTEGGETKPLLHDKITASGSGEVRRIPIWKNPSVMVNFFIYFIMKLLMECVSSSTSILTYYYFDWNGSWAGYWLAFLCFLVLPVNLVVAHLSKTYEDREMMIVLQAVTIVGCIIIMRFGEEYYIEQYMTGSLIIVVFSNMVEGPNMSLLSKTIPKSWRKGFLNVGLLATEAATLGRTVGDIWLALCGLPGLEHQLNLTFGSMIIATTFTLWISYRFYDSLVATEDKTL